MNTNGKIVTKADLRTIREKLMTSTAQTPNIVRSIFFSVIRKYDRVPADLVPVVLKFVALMYDRDGVGYHGVISEIVDRVSLYSAIDGFVYAGEFLVHKMGVSDIYDKENRTSYEKKTGCGDWLRSETPSFSETIAIYRRKRTLIRWDYTFTIESKKNGQERFSIHIETSYRKLFDFLADYNGSIETWFKENSRSGLSGVYVWEMQTIKTSRKKAMYLTTFDAWEKAHR